MLFNRTDMSIQQGNGRTRACALKHYVNAHAPSRSMEWVFVSLPLSTLTQVEKNGCPGVGANRTRCQLTRRTDARVAPSIVRVLDRTN